MYKISVFIIFLLVFYALMAQTVQGDGLISALPLNLLIGAFLCIGGFGLSVFAWRKEGKGPIDAAQGKRADKFGCIGLVIGGIGVLCLLPLLFVIQSFIGFIIGALVLLGAGYVIYRIVK